MWSLELDQSSDLLACVVVPLHIEFLVLRSLHNNHRKVTIVQHNVIDSVAISFNVTFIFSDIDTEENKTAIRRLSQNNTHLYTLMLSPLP